MDARSMRAKTSRRESPAPMYCIHKEELKIPTSELAPTAVKNIAWKEITEEVQLAVSFSRIRQGSVLLYPLHTTASIVLNEPEEGLVGSDVPRAFERLVPNGVYAHDRAERILAREGEPKNGPSHIRSMLAGSKPTELIVDNGLLVLGTWQRIMFLDFDPDHRAERGIAIQVRGFTA